MLCCAGRCLPASPWPRARGSWLESSCPLPLPVPPLPLPVLRTSLWPTTPATPFPSAGDSETLKIQLTHVHRYDLWIMGVWPVQKKKGLRCSNRAVYERMVIKLSRLLQKGRGEGGEEEAGTDPALRRFAGATLADLAILSRPYLPPPPAPAEEGAGADGGAMQLLAPPPPPSQPAPAGAARKSVATPVPHC